MSPRGSQVPHVDRLAGAKSEIFEGQAEEMGRQAQGLQIDLSEALKSKPRSDCEKMKGLRRRKSAFSALVRTKKEEKIALGEVEVDFAWQPAGI